MVSVYPTPPGQDFHYMGDPMKMGLMGLHPVQSVTNSNSNTGLVVSDDHNKKTRKPYTITKSRESWTEQEHDKFLEALQLFDRDWKKIEAFVGSKTVIQIRSHAQKYFLKVQKSGTSEHVPPPRPKRKASHPYPQKAPKKVMSQVGSIQFQLPGALPEPEFGIGPDPLSVPGNTINFSPWTYDNVPAISTTQMRKDDAQLSGGGVMQNCSSSSNESMPRICMTEEGNDQKESRKQMKDVTRIRIYTLRQRDANLMSIGRIFHVSLVKISLWWTAEALHWMHMQKWEKIFIGKLKSRGHIIVFKMSPRSHPKIDVWMPITLLSILVDKCNSWKKDNTLKLVKL